MNEKDKNVLDAMAPALSQILTEQQIGFLHEEVEKAGGIMNTTGVARELLEKTAAAIVAGVGTSFGGNRSAAGAYAARVRWGGRGAGDAKPLGSRTASTVGASGWKEADDAGSKALADLGPDHPEHQRVMEVVRLVGNAKRSDDAGATQVTPVAAQRAASDARLASRTIGLVLPKKNIPPSVGQFAEVIGKIATSLTQRAQQAE